MSKVSILCLAAGIFAVSVPACDAGSSSHASGDTQLGADAGYGNFEESVAGASGEGGAAGGQPTDSTTGCERLSVVQCRQFYTCLSASALANNTSLLGTTEADCVALFNTANCTNTACPSGETFMPGNMDRCVANFAALSCDEFVAVANQTVANPAGCNSICE